jgi:hypothetical protein
MTSSSCHPASEQYSRNPFNDDGNPIGVAVGEMLIGKEGGKNIETRNWDVVKVREKAKQAGIVSNMSYENLEAYWVSEGWASINKDGELIGNRSFDPEVMGIVADTTNTFLQQRGGAVRDLAGEFLRKVNGGVDATAEGMALAREMQGVGRTAEVMLGWRQKLGRGLDALNNAESPNLNPISKIEYDQSIKDADKLNGLNAKFAEIAAKLGDPEQAGEAINMLIETAEAVRYLDNPADIARATTGMTIAGKWWSTLFINGLLSNTNTLLTNVAALSYAVARPAMQIVGAQAFSVWAPGIKRQAMLEASASLGAMYEAAGDALLVGRRAFMEELPTHTKVDAERGLGFTKAEARGLLGENANPGVLDVIGKFGQVVRLPGRALLGTDEVAKHLAIRGEVAARGVRRALKDGADVTTREAMTKAVQEEMAMAFNLDRKEVWDKYAFKGGEDYDLGQFAEYGRSVYTVAEEATFQQNNRMANQVNKILKTAPALRPFFPFIKTPTNILITGFESVGVGAVGNAFNIAKQNSFNPSATLLDIQKKLLQDPAQSALYAGQVATMSLIITTVWGQVMSGNMSGGGPAVYMPQGKRKEAQYAWKKQGNEAYTWKTPAGNIPFARMPEPFATIMRMTADAGSYSAYMTTEEQEGVTAAIAGLMATSVFDASFFGSLQTFLDVFTDPSRINGNLGKLAKDYAATQVPFGGLLSQIDRANDPYKGIIEPVGITEMWRIHENLFTSGIFSKIADRMPGVTRPQHIDPVSGDPVFIYPGYGPEGMNPFEQSIPMFPRNLKSDEAYDVLFKVTGGLTQYGGANKLTDTEQQELNGYISKVRINGVSFQDAIIKFGRRPDVAEYMRLKGNTTLNVRTKIQDELNKIRRRYEAIGYRDLVSANDSVLTRSAKISEIKRAKKTGDFQRQSELQTELDGLFNRARRGY